MKLGTLTLFFLVVGALFLVNRTDAQTHSWQTEIYDNQWLNGEPAVRRTDGAIAFDWGTGAPSGGVEPDFFSLRWTGQMFLNENSKVRFSVRADDGIRIFVDGQTVLYAWEGEAKPGVAKDRWLTAGNHTVVVEYFEHSGNAFAFFEYEIVETNATPPQGIPTIEPTPRPVTGTPLPQPTWTNVPPATNTPRPPQPTLTPVPSLTNTPRPTSVPSATSTPQPTATQLPTQIVPTAEPTPTAQPTPTETVNPSTPPSSSRCDLMPQFICR